MRRKTIYTFGTILIIITLFKWFRLEEPNVKTSNTSSKRNIALLTYYSHDEYGMELKNMTWENKINYGKLHNIDVYDLGESTRFRYADLKDKMSFNPYFSKIIGIQLLLNITSKKYDWVIWQDADSIFFNFSKQFHSVLDENYDVIFPVGSPENPKWKLVINAGSFAIKNSKFSNDFLNDMLKLSEFGCKEMSSVKPILLEPFNNWLRICDDDGKFWLSDQGASMVLYLFSEPSYTCHFKKIWFRVLLSEFPWYGEGDMCVHFPGRSNSNRKELINAFQKSDFKNGKINSQSIEIKNWPLDHGNGVEESDLLYKDYNTICKH